MADGGMITIKADEYAAFDVEYVARVVKPQDFEKASDIAKDCSYVFEKHNADYGDVLLACAFLVGFVGKGSGKPDPATQLEQSLHLFTDFVRFFSYKPEDNGGAENV